jgi:hypothetical protein
MGFPGELGDAFANSTDPRFPFAGQDRSLWAIVCPTSEREVFLWSLLMYEHLKQCGLVLP